MSLTKVGFKCKINKKCLHLCGNCFALHNVMGGGGGWRAGTLFFFKTVVVAYIFRNLPNIDQFMA